MEHGMILYLKGRHIDNLRGIILSGIMNDVEDCSRRSEIDFVAGKQHL